MSRKPEPLFPDDACKPARRLSPGRLAQIACLLEVTAPKPGNVHRFADLAGLHLVDFLASATAIAEPLDHAADEGIGKTVYRAIEATRQVVRTNTNLGIVLLLAPLAAVSHDVDLEKGVEDVLAATTVEDASWAYRAIRLARPGGLGTVAEQDVEAEPTVTLRAAMALAAERDLIARQYADGFHEVLAEAAPLLRAGIQCGRGLETAIVGCSLNLLARHPDSLIARKYGLAVAQAVSERAGRVLHCGWPDRDAARAECAAFDTWLRQAKSPINPGTTADLVTAALYVALRDGTIDLPLSSSFGVLPGARSFRT
jgi:triphosphoribosyl-dephospho-CoA synthase